MWRLYLVAFLQRLLARVSTTDGTLDPHRIYDVAERAIAFLRRITPGGDRAMAGASDEHPAELHDQFEEVMAGLDD